ncbi:unnamed protein product [Vitrella brassicaformis CCMP3155]|uniref:Uncharacterized protein n=1 Tax=Vitrella brassicaformis (strain CCMP3155) TaxID=1169540 RepID=A0A0G4GWY8_VITBC|nr:unnamed protein product [Vitrella brassicaformis CCMP3155]|eukprot:CEM35428.1 unnamed protein product [Vitrella brassicaformis CCMP3155]
MAAAKGLYELGLWHMPLNPDSAKIDEIEGVIAAFPTLDEALNEELMSFIEDRDQAKEYILKLEERTEELDDLWRKVRDEKRELEQQLREELQKYRDDIAAREEALQTMAAQRDSLAKSVSTLSEDLRKQADEVLAAKRAMQEANEAKLDAERDKERAVASLTHTTRDKIRRLESANHSLEAQSAEIPRLKQQFSEQLGSERKAAEAARKEKDDLQRDRNQLAERLDHETSALESARAKLDQTRREKAEVEAKDIETSSKMASLKAQLEGETAALEEAREEARAAKERQEELLSQDAQNAVTLAEMTEKLHKQAEGVAAAERALHQAEEERDRLAEQHKDAADTIEELTKEVKSATEALRKAEEGMEAIAHERDVLADRLASYQGMPPLQPTHTPHCPMAPQHPPMQQHPAPFPPHPNVLPTPAFGNPNAPSIQQQPKGGMVQAANGYGGGHGSPQLQPQQPGGGGGGYGCVSGYWSPPLNLLVAPAIHGYGGSPFQGHPAPSPPLQNLGVLVGGSSTQHHYQNQPLAASSHRGGGHDGHPSYGAGSPFQQPANPWPHMTPAIAQRGHEIDIDPLAGLDSVSSRPPFDHNAHRMPPQSHVDQLPRQQRPQNGSQGIGMGLWLGSPPQQQQQTGVRASSPDDWLSPPPGSAVPPFSPYGQPAGGGAMGDGLFDAPRGAVDMSLYGVGPPVAYVETGVRSGGSGGGMRTGSGGSGHGSQASGGMAATNDPDAISADRSGYELFPRSEAPGGLFGRLGPAASRPQPSHPPFPPRASPFPPLMPSHDAAQAPHLHPHPAPAIGAASSAADPNLLFGNWTNRLGGYGGQPEDHRAAAAATASESHRHVQGRRGLGSARREGRGAGGLFGGGQTSAAREPHQMRDRSQSPPQKKGCLCGLWC